MCHGTSWVRPIYQRKLASQLAPSSHLSMHSMPLTLVRWEKTGPVLRTERASRCLSFASAPPTRETHSVACPRVRHGQLRLRQGQTGVSSVNSASCPLGSQSKEVLRCEIRSGHGGWRSMKSQPHHGGKEAHHGSATIGTASTRRPEPRPAPVARSGQYSCSVLPRGVMRFIT